MFITVAGEKKEVKDGLTLPELIAQENVETVSYTHLVVSMDVEAIVVIKKNSKKIIIRKDVSRQWRSYRSTSFLCYFTERQIVF